MIKSRNDARIAAKIAGLSIVLLWSTACALEPSQILVIANDTNRASTRIAEYYADKRQIPPEQILRLPLQQPLLDSIDRQAYLDAIADPVRQFLRQSRNSGTIKCLVTVYGIPYKIRPTGPAKEDVILTGDLQRIHENRSELLRRIALRLEDAELKRVAVDPQKPPAMSVLLQDLPARFDNALALLEAGPDRGKQSALKSEWLALYIEAFGKPAGWKKAMAMGLDSTPTREEQLLLQEDSRRLQKARDEQWTVRQKFDARLMDSLERLAGLTGLLTVLESDLDRLKGKETGGSLDSELALIQFDDYPLYRWQPNELKNPTSGFGTRTLMVSRLDGPEESLILGLVDKALSAEKSGLKGTAYFDCRYANPAGDALFFQYDRSIRAAAALVRKHTDLHVVEDHRAELFPPGSCPAAALYCGWYSLRKYVDAFDFVPGAVGYHIASFEASDLRNPASTEWVSAMLRDGITATLGPVNEPYLSAFPLPDDFFGELIHGRCLAEAYYRSNPFNSWQMLLIGDPLYRPFPPKADAPVTGEAQIR